MPEPKKPLDPGFLTRHLSNPFISVPFAIASGVGAGLTPGTARVTRGIHGGLGLGLSAEEEDFKKRKEQRLSQSLAPIIQGIGSPTTKTRPKAITDLHKELEEAAKVPSARLSDFVNPSPDVTETIQPSDRDKRLGSFLSSLNEADPSAAATVLSKELTRTPTEAKIFGSETGGFFRNVPGEKPERIVPGIGRKPESVKAFRPPKFPTTEVYTAESIRKWRVTRTKTNPRGDQTLLVPRDKPLKAGDFPPSMTDANARAMQAKLDRGGTLNKRELAILDANNVKDGIGILKEYQAIKVRQDTKTAVDKNEAIFQVERGRFTGDENRIYRINPDTGNLEDAVTEKVPEQIALSEGWRKISADEQQTVTRGKATLDSLDDFEKSARLVLAKNPGIINMTWQNMTIWFQTKASDKETVLFQTQMFRTLPLMIQSMGLSGARTGVRLLEIEKAALPNSGMTLGTALAVLDRDRKTINDIRKSVVSGESHPMLDARPGQTQGPETADDVRRRFELPPRGQ